MTPKLPAVVLLLKSAPKREFNFSLAQRSFTDNNISPFGEFVSSYLDPAAFVKAKINNTGLLVLGYTQALR